MDVQALVDICRLLVQFRPRVGDGPRVVRHWLRVGPWADRCGDHGDLLGPWMCVGWSLVQEPGVVLADGLRWGPGWLLDARIECWDDRPVICGHRRLLGGGIVVD
jgi:hypothetical protein